MSNLLVKFSIGAALKIPADAIRSNATRPCPWAYWII
jgi:hypothetical protein